MIDIKIARAYQAEGLSFVGQCIVGRRAVRCYERLPNFTLLEINCIIGRRSRLSPHEVRVVKHVGWRAFSLALTDFGDRQGCLL